MDDEQLFAARTRIVAPPLLPELSLHLAAEIVPLWQETETDAGTTPPPYWGFPWVGGQAVARYLLDHPELVRGRTVLDLGTGSGVVAIAAARAGAASVLATDIDPRAVLAARRNASLNGVAIELLERDVLGDERTEEVIVAGDLCYEQQLAGRVLSFLRRHSARATVLVGDPGRNHFVADGLEELARYDVPRTGDVESGTSRSAAVYRMTA